MKLTILSAITALVLLSTVNTASAAKFTNPAGSTTTSVLLNGIAFKPSTSVAVDAMSAPTAFAAAAKHETGGTSMYGMTSSDVTITIKTDMAKSDPVTDQTSTTALSGFGSGS